jgi:hypothetical protein
MHKITIRLCALFLLAGTTGPVAAQGAPTEDVAARRETPQAEQLCNYCQDYTDAAVSADPITTAYQVGVGYPQVAQPQELARQEAAKVAVTPTTTN